MGCQPQGSLHSPSHADPSYSLASQTQLQETVSVSHPMNSHQQYSSHSSASPSVHHQIPSSLSLQSRTESQIYSNPVTPDTERVVPQQRLEEPSVRLPSRGVAETITVQYFSDGGEGQQQLPCCASAGSSQHLPSSFAGRACDCRSLVDNVQSCFTQPLQSVNTAQPSLQQTLPQSFLPVGGASPSHHQLSPTSYCSTMLDKKPVLQVRLWIL